MVQAAFQPAGDISDGRGVVNVLDRQALEVQVSDCYAIIAGQLAALDAAD